MDYETQPEIVLYGITDVPQSAIPEVKLTFTPDVRPLKQLRSTDEVADYFRSLYEPGTIDLQEQVLVLFLTPINTIKGFYRHSVGTVDSATVDFRLILSGAIKSLSFSIAIAHNHPSGHARPSEADNKLTKDLIDACTLLRVRLLDHIILTATSYYSMRQNRFPGLEGFDPRVLRRYTTSFSQWSEIPMEQALQDLVNEGEPEQVRARLEGGETIKTDFAEYKIDIDEQRTPDDPAWIRARLKLMEELKGSYRENDERTGPGGLLRQGIISEEIWKEKGFESEKHLVDHRLSDGQFSNSRLRFSEVTRYNSWFKLHPEKIAGEEVLTTSLQFPLTIKGSKEDILKMFNKAQTTNKKPDMELARARARAMKMQLELLALDGVNAQRSWLDGFSSLSEENALEELGALNDATGEHISQHPEVIQAIINKGRSKKKVSSSDTLSFEEIVRLYNVGISEDEIKVWVWYKRTFSIPMKGWEKYYLPDTGSAHDQVFTTRQTIIKDNHFRDLNAVPAGILIGKPTRFKNEYAGTNYLVITGTDNNKYYVAEKDVEIRRAMFKTDQKILDDYVRKGLLFILGGNLVPYPVYVLGNMYDRQLALDGDKEGIVGLYGEDVYNAHQQAIEKAKPKLISVINPDTKERPQILSIGEFANTFLIKDLRVETGIDLSTISGESATISLTDAFKLWLRSLEPTTFKESSAHDIIHYYIEAHNLSKKLSPAEKEQIEKFAPIEGEELFARFLYEAVLFEDQQKIDFKWNREFNGQSSVQHAKIPIGFTCSAMFKKSVLEFTPPQREAVAFMEAVGSGIIAYDVGVGKTMSAIITLANAMYQGKCAAPVIVVPNATYNKWMREIIGYVDEKTGEFIPGVLSNTKIQVNDWYNLSRDIANKIDLSEKIRPNTITVVTYEGFVKIGFSRKAMELLFDHLANVLGQNEDESRSARDMEKLKQKYREIVGTGLKNTVADIDTLGVDYIVIDEGHNFKNVFSDVKAGRDSVRRFNIQGGTSERAVKAFFLCNYIQRTYRQNVMLLSATPFTNSPLEIYSMLSHVAFESMKNMGISNIQVFMETFIKQTIEYAPNYKNEIVATPVVKSFNNRLVLQKLLYNHINYKTGEEAGVRRPCKVNLPRINSMQEDGTIKRLPPERQVLTYLAMTPLQKANQQDIVDLAKDGTAYDSKIMVALGQSLDNALSPFLYKHSSEPEDYLEFVEESPKILYALQCIRTVKEHHESRNESVSGQIIYANRGKDYFHYIKEYLEKEIGFKQKVRWGKLSFDEVEIVSSDVSQGRKESIKDAFLEGIVKIIIGTATIREGVDLQTKCTNIYNLYPDWNPTEVKQLEGRAWRQGNEFGYIRVTMPLVENSMDIFVFQKLDEKTHRINDIWFRGDRGNVMDLDSLDPEEVKFALFTNINALAQMQIKKELSDVTRRYNIISAQIDTLRRLDFKIRQYFEFREKSMQRVGDLVNTFKTYFFEQKNYKQAAWYEEMTEEGRSQILDEVKIAVDEAEVFLSASVQEDKELLRIGKQLYRSIKDTGMKDTRDQVFNEFKVYLSEVRKAERTILSQKGYTINDNFREITAMFEKDRSEVAAETQRIQSEEYFKQVHAEIIEKKKRFSIQGKDTEERVADFASLNYLLNYKFNLTDTENCILPDPGERQSSSKSSSGSNSERDRKLKLAKAKALAMKMQLELMEID
jgi:hypothetical protein